MVPVSVRPDVDDPRGSNQVSAMFVQLPVHLDDPLDRLRAIHDGTKGAKEEHKALGADILLNWAEHATPNVFATRRPALLPACGWPTGTGPSPTWSSPTSPGRTSPSTWPEPSSQAGFPLGPVMDGMGLNITIMSYRGVLYWGIIACPDTIPRVWNLTASIPLALDELLAAAGEAPAVYRSEAAAAAVRASGIEVEPPPPEWTGTSARPSGSTDRARPDYGAGATAMDEAPVHTGMARPKVWEAGS